MFFEEKEQITEFFVRPDNTDNQVFYSSEVKYKKKKRRISYLEVQRRGESKYTRLSSCKFTLIEYILNSLEKILLAIPYSPVQTK